MSEELGPVKYGETNQSPFLPGAAYEYSKTHSEKTAEIIDKEVKALIEAAHKRDKEMLEAQKGILEDLAVKLLEKETLGSEEIDEIIKKKDAKPATG